MRSGHPAIGEGDEHVPTAPSTAHLPDHVEIDDAAVQLGILDGAQGLDDVGFGDGTVLLERARAGRSAEFPPTA